MKWALAPNRKEIGPLNALVMYDSLGGNTEKVATGIRDALGKASVDCDLVKVTSETTLDLYQYDLIFSGSPVIAWLPTKTLMDFVQRKLDAYRDAGEIRPAAPLRPGRYAVCFCTYAGPHTGLQEAVPLTKWLRAFFEHLGYLVLDEWHVVGELHKETDLNTEGRLGDIRGRPNEQDLDDVRNRVRGILSSLP